MALSWRYIFYSALFHILCVLLLNLSGAISSPSNLDFVQSHPLSFEVLEQPAAASLVKAVRGTSSGKVSQAAESATSQAINLPPLARAENTSVQVANSASESLGLIEGGVRELTLEDRYKYELRKLIEGKKKYPAAAKTMGYTGTVLIELTLDRTGKILDSKIIKGSHPSLDEAAQRLISAIDGLKPFPDELKREQWSFQVPIQYLL